MKRNPHPDLVRAALKRWRSRLLRALTEVAKLERTLVRAEKKREDEKRAAETMSRRERKARAEHRERIAIRNAQPGWKDVQS